jgi:hypothetical protein
LPTARNTLAEQATQDLRQQAAAVARGDDNAQSRPTVSRRQARARIPRALVRPLMWDWRPATCRNAN